VSALRDAGIRVSLFIDADRAQLDAAAELSADIVELHTGRYCDLTGDARAKELERLRDGARYGASLGLEVHAGHGLDYDTVKDVAAFPEVMELNIGHFLVGEAIFTGFDVSIREMRRLMIEARK